MSFTSSYLMSPLSRGSAVIIPVCQTLTAAGVLISCVFHLSTAAYSSTFCSALVTHNLVPGLIQLLPFSHGINTMVRVSLSQALRSQPSSHISHFYRFAVHPRTCLYFAQVLRVLANIAHKKSEHCVQLAHLGLLPALCATLKMADPDMVTLSMEVLFMLVVSGTKVSPLKTLRRNG